MSDVLKLIASLRRPKLLIRAARFGLDDYNRERDLCRLTRRPACPSPRAAVEQLIEAEAELEGTRKAGGVGYSAAHHVEILIALIAEARLLPRPSADV